jgi:hypothetical protein
LIVGFVGGGGGSGAGSGGGDHAGGAAPVSYQASSTPKPSLLASVVRRCDKLPFTHGRHGIKPTTKNPFAHSLALSEVSQGYVGLIANAGGDQSFCVTAVHPSGYLPDGGGEGFPTVVPGNDKLSDAGAGGFGALEGSVSYDFGRAGRDVSAIEFVFPHGNGVKAMVEHGWYLALWPGAARSNAPTSVRVTTRSGIVISPMSGPKCQRDTSACVFVSQPPAPRERVTTTAPLAVSNPLGTVPTLPQLLATSTGQSFIGLTRPRHPSAAVSVQAVYPGEVARIPLRYTHSTTLAEIARVWTSASKLSACMARRLRCERDRGLIEQATTS